MSKTCKKLPNYKCNKNSGLDCLGCIKYNYYSQGYQEGKEQYEKILSDYGLTPANFREACFALAMLKGEGRKQSRTVDDIDKQLKALNIIAEKRVSVSLLLNTKNNWDYNDHVSRAQIYLHSNSKCLTQEEFDLLRGVLL